MASGVKENTTWHDDERTVAIIIVTEESARNQLSLGYLPDVSSTSPGRRQTKLEKYLQANWHLLVEYTG